MIEVERLDIDIQSNHAPEYGWDGRLRGFAKGKPSARVRVEFVADGEDLDRIIDYFRRAQRGEQPPALPPAVKRLPQGPVDAEFVEDDAP